MEVSDGDLTAACGHVEDVANAPQALSHAARSMELKLIAL
jgi:hypothetical protein